MDKQYHIEKFVKHVLLENQSHSRKINNMKPLIIQNRVVNSWRQIDCSPIKLVSFQSYQNRF